MGLSCDCEDTSKPSTKTWTLRGDDVDGLRLEKRVRTALSSAQPNGPEVTIQKVGAQLLYCNIYVTRSER